VLAFDPAQNVLGDSISAIGFTICFYYGLTGLACIVFFRKELFKSARNLLLAGLVPLLGFLMMGAIFIKALHDYSKAGFNYSPPLLGIQVPIAIGIGSLLLGVVLMLAAWVAYPKFFRRRPYIEAGGPGSLDEVLVSHPGEVSVPEAS
jgi:hypothetical protein